MSTEMRSDSLILVFGATGRTGRHFVAEALRAGQRVRALVRDRRKMNIESSALDVHEGSIADVDAIDDLVHGVDAVICML